MANGCSIPKENASLESLTMFDSVPKMNWGLAMLGSSELPRGTTHRKWCPCQGVIEIATLPPPNMDPENSPSWVETILPTPYLVGRYEQNGDSRGYPMGFGCCGIWFCGVGLFENSQDPKLQWIITMFIEFPDEHMARLEESQFFGHREIAW